MLIPSCSYVFLCVCESMFLDWKLSGTKDNTFYFCFISSQHLVPFLVFPNGLSATYENIPSICGCLWIHESYLLALLWLEKLG